MSRIGSQKSDERAWHSARKMAVSGWVPIVRGNIYCSPRCGFLCQKAAYDRAVKEGAELAVRMGAGWTSRVWENCGWHYEAVKGVASIMPNIHGGKCSGDWTIEGYTADLQSGVVQIIERAPTPEDALGYALQQLRGVERQIAADCAALYADGSAR